MPNEILIRSKISSLVNENAPVDKVREAIDSMFVEGEETTDVEFLKSIIKELLVHSTAKEKSSDGDTPTQDGTNSVTQERPLPAKMTEIILSQLSGQCSPLRTRTKKLLRRQIEKHKNDTSSKSKKGSKLRFVDDNTSPLTYGTHINASKKKTSTSSNTNSGKVKTSQSSGKIAGAPAKEVNNSSDDESPPWMDRKYKRINNGGQSNDEDVGTDTGTINTTNAVSGKQHRNSSKKHNNSKEGNGTAKIRQQLHIPRPKHEQNAGSDSSFIDTDGIGGDADIEDYRPTRKNINKSGIANGYDGEYDNREGEGDDPLTPSSSAIELNMMPSTSSATNSNTSPDGMNMNNNGNGIANTTASTRIRASRLGTVSLPTLQELGLRNGLPEDFYPPDAPANGQDSDNGDNIDDIQLRTNPVNLSLYNNMSDENLSVSDNGDDDQEALSNCSDVPSQSSGDGDDQIYDDEMYAQAIDGWRQVLPLEKSSSDQNLMEYQLKKNYNLTHHDFLKGILDDIDTLAEQPSPVSSGKPSPEMNKSSTKDMNDETEESEMQFNTQVVYPCLDTTNSVDAVEGNALATDSAIRFGAADLIDDNMQRRVMKMMAGDTTTDNTIKEKDVSRSLVKDLDNIVFNTETVYPGMPNKTRSSLTEDAGEIWDSDEAKLEFQRKIKEVEAMHLNDLPTRSYNTFNSTNNSPGKDYVYRQKTHQKDLSDHKLTSLELKVDSDSDDEKMKGNLSGYRRRHYAHEKPTTASQNRRRPKLVDELKNSNTCSTRSSKSSKRDIPYETLSSPTYRAECVPFSNSRGSGVQSPGSPYRIDVNAPDTYVNSLSRALAGHEHTVALKKAYAAKRGTKQLLNSSKDVVARLAESVMNLESIAKMTGTQTRGTGNGLYTRIYSNQVIARQTKGKKVSKEATRSKHSINKRAATERPSSTTLVTPPDTIERVKNARLQRVAEASQAVQSGYTRDESFGIYDTEMRWKRYLIDANDKVEISEELDLSSPNVSNTDIDFDRAEMDGNTAPTLALDDSMDNIDEILAAFERSAEEKFTNLMDIPEGIPVDTHSHEFQENMAHRIVSQGDTDSLTRQSVDSTISLSKFIEKHHAIDHFGENYDSVDSSTANMLSIDDRAGKPSYDDLPVDNDDHLNPDRHMANAGEEGLDARFKDSYNEILQQYSSDVREKMNGGSQADQGATSTKEAVVDDGSGDVLHPSVNVRVTPHKLRGSIDVSGHNDQSGHHHHSKKIGIMDKLPSTLQYSVSASLESGDIKILDKHAHYQELHEANQELMNGKNNRYEYMEDDGSEEHEEVLRASNNSNKVIAFSTDQNTGVLRFPEFEDVDGGDVELHSSNSSNMKSSPTSVSRRLQHQNRYMSNTSSATRNNNTHKLNGEHKGNTKVLKQKYKITVFTPKGEYDPIAFFPKTVAGGTSYGPPKYTTRSKGKGKGRRKSEVIDNRDSHASLEAAVRVVNEKMSMLEDSIASESSRVRQATSELSSPTFKRTTEAALETLNETGKIEFVVKETRRKNTRVLKKSKQKR